jgi:hypothetical protein
MTQDKLSEERLRQIIAHAETVAEWQGPELLSICRELLALRSAMPMPGVKPVAYLINDPMAGEPEVSFIKTLGIENIPLYTAPPAREISEAEVERAARAIDALWSEGQDRGPAFEDTEREYQAHCRSTARAALEAARSPS